MVYGLSFKVEKDTLSKGLIAVQNAIANGIVDGAEEETKRIAEYAEITLMENMNTYNPKGPISRTGNLAASIMVDIHRAPKGIENTFFVFVDEDKAPYAKYVEFGHQSFEGYHFMEQAYQMALLNIKDTMAENISVSLSKITF